MLQFAASFNSRIILRLFIRWGTSITQLHWQKHWSCPGHEDIITAWLAMYHQCFDIVLDQNLQLCSANALISFSTKTCNYVCQCFDIILNQNLQLCSANALISYSTKTWNYGSMLAQPIAGLCCQMLGKPSMGALTFLLLLCLLIFLVSSCRLVLNGHCLSRARHRKTHFARWGWSGQPPAKSWFLRSFSCVTLGTRLECWHRKVVRFWIFE
jgi:hypothetical protein